MRPTTPITLPASSITYGQQSRSPALTNALARMTKAYGLVVGDESQLTVCDPHGGRTTPVVVRDRNEPHHVDNGRDVVHVRIRAFSRGLRSDHDYRHHAAQPPKVGRKMRAAIGAHTRQKNPAPRVPYAGGGREPAQRVAPLRSNAHYRQGVSLIVPSRAAADQGLIDQHNLRVSTRTESHRRAV